MAGCRKFTEDEMGMVAENLKTIRDKALFILGCSTGFRITELLSLKIKDIYNAETKTIVNHVKVQRKNVKGKTVGREVELTVDAKRYLESLIKTPTTKLDPENALFQSKRRHGSICIRAVRYILHEAYDILGLTGTLGTHAMRKTYTFVIWEGTGHDIVATSRALGHSDIRTTQQYIPDNPKVAECIRSIKFV